MRWAALLALSAELAACSSQPAAPKAADTAPFERADAGVRPKVRPAPADAGPDIGFLEPTATLGRLSSAPLTLAQSIEATHPILSPPDPGPPSTPSVLSRWLSEGYGLTTLGAGEPLVDVPPPDAGVPAPGASPSMLLRFVHLPDIQLADDESPTRVCELDLPAPEAATDGAFRPQEGYQCRVLDAAVRTINTLNRSLPVSFVLLGGDNADNAQTNEIGWFMDIMDGAPFVKCDSGDYDDPVPGPNNDGKDPFSAVGLDVPWWWVTGNHDVEIGGTLVVDAETQSEAVGTTDPLKTRNYALPGAPLSAGPLVPDPRRVPLLRADLMKLVAADTAQGNAGHGVGAAQVASGKAFYSFDVANTPIRFVILDTCAETGGADGILHQADIDSTIKPMLDQAQADGKWVITASHHPSDDLMNGGSIGGTVQADAVTEQQWVDFLGGYDNLLFSLVGHVHTHRVRYVTPTSGHSFWEVMTGSLADYPHQFRLIEIWDDDNGWVRMRAIVTDYQTENDEVAATGRELGIADLTSGWAHDGYGTETDRNIELYIPKP